MEPVARPWIVDVERFEDQERLLQLATAIDGMLEREVEVQAARRDPSPAIRRSAAWLNRKIR